VKQQPGDGDMTGGPPAFWPGRPDQQGEGQHQGDHDPEPQGQEGHGLGVRQTELGTDKTGAPQKHEDRRHDRRRQVSGGEGL